MYEVISYRQLLKYFEGIPNRLVPSDHFSLASDFVMFWFLFIIYKQSSKVLRSPNSILHSSSDILRTKPKSSSSPLLASLLEPTWIADFRLYDRMLLLHLWNSHTQERNKLLLSWTLPFSHLQLTSTCLLLNGNNLGLVWEYQYLPIPSPWESL